MITTYTEILKWLKLFLFKGPKTWFYPEPSLKAAKTLWINFEVAEALCPLCCCVGSHFLLELLRYSILYGCTY